MRRRARTIATVAPAAIALAGCGDLSLVGSLKQEDPGALRFSPSDPVVHTGAALTISVLGGITPYADLSGSVSFVDDHTLQFASQPAGGQFPIQVSDLAGKTVQTVVTVYSGTAPAINVTELTLPEGPRWTFTVSGGVSPFAWELDGSAQGEGDSWPFPSIQPAGTYVVGVIDSAGASAAASVTVVPSGIGTAALGITPAAVVVLQGGQAVFTALGGDGAYLFSAPDGGSLTAGNPAVYTAPAAGGEYSILLSDGEPGTPVEAKVFVSTSGSLPVLSPGSVTVSAIGDTVQFNVTGGTPDYVFTSGKPAIGSVDPVTGLYQQQEPGNVLVTVTDADGLTDNTLVRWKP